MTQSSRGFPYTATAIDPGGAPITGIVDGPAIATVTGERVMPGLAHHATVPHGTRYPVQLTSTEHGPAWHVTGGPHAGYLIPYHHPSWSVNPVPIATPGGPGGGPLTGPLPPLKLRP